MCGRYTSAVPTAMLRERFEVEAPEGYEELYNVAPSRRVLAVREREDGARCAGLRRWGLVPRWAKDSRIGSKMLNARAGGGPTHAGFGAAARFLTCRG